MTDALIVKVRLMRAFLSAQGWIPRNTEGDHHQFVHPTIPGKVTLAGEGSDDIPPHTLSSILKQAKTSTKELRRWLNR